MSDLPQPPASLATPSAETAPAPDEQHLIEEDLLVEEVSIDGMCGVY